MTITKEVESILKGDPFFLEIEMLQGERIEMTDGRLWYKIEIADSDKSELMREFVLKMISNSHNASPN